MTTMTRQEVRQMAERAAQGERKALEELKTLAKAAHFIGKPGGWIYREGYSAPVCQGWAALAMKVALGGPTGWVLDRIMTALEFPEPEVTAKDALAAIGGCWAGGALTGKALKAYADGDYRLALAITVDQKALQEKGGQDALHPEHQTRVAQAETLAEVAQEVLDLVEEGQTPELAQALVLEPRQETRVQLMNRPRPEHFTDLGPGVAVAPMGTPEPGPEDLSDLAQALADEDLEHLEPEEVRAPKPRDLRCEAGDVVTIHRGDRLYEVLQVEEDLARDRVTGEATDLTMARVAPCDPEDHRDPQWIHVDLLHVRTPVARVHTVGITERVRQTQEVFTLAGRKRLVAIRTILMDSRRVPVATLVEVPSLPVGREPHLRVGEAVVVDGRVFRVVDLEGTGELSLEPARWRDRLPVG